MIIIRSIDQPKIIERNKVKTIFEFDYRNQKGTLVRNDFGKYTIYNIWLHRKQANWKVNSWEKQIEEYTSAFKANDPFDQQFINAVKQKFRIQVPYSREGVNI